MIEGQSELGERSAKATLPYDIAIVGPGIVGVHQITREVDEVLWRSRCISLVDSGYGIMDYLKTFCPDVSDIAYLYETVKIARRHTARWLVKWSPPR